MVVNVQIDPTGYYDDAAVRKLLGLSKQRLTRAINSGELRATERAGKRYLLGQWLIDWLEGSEQSNEVAP